MKKTVYPKTKRLEIEPKIEVTEKLDGSNLCIGKLNGELVVCQRNNVFIGDEITESNITYRGLYGWLEEHKEYLKEHIIDGSVICGEWLGMGYLKYDFECRYFMYAKARFTEDYDLIKINHDYDSLHYVFDNQTFPEFIQRVPLVGIFRNVTKDFLDIFYETYTDKVKRNVEGFVINYGQGEIKKYVRMKHGRIQEHHD